MLRDHLLCKHDPSFQRFLPLLSLSNDSNNFGESSRCPISRRSLFGKDDALLASRNIPNERGCHVACHKTFEDFRFLTIHPEIRTSWPMQDTQLGQFGPRLEVCPRNQRLKTLEQP